MNLGTAKYNSSTKRQIFCPAVYHLLSHSLYSYCFYRPCHLKDRLTTNSREMCFIFRDRSEEREKNKLFRFHGGDLRENFVIFASEVAEAAVEQWLGVGFKVELGAINF